MPSLATPDTPIDDRALTAALARLGMRLWQHPSKPGIGTIFCPKCGDRGGIEIVIARWLEEPVGCFRFGSRSCNGRPFR